MHIVRNAVAVPCAGIVPIARFYTKNFAASSGNYRDGAAAARGAGASARRAAGEIGGRCRERRRGEAGSSGQTAAPRGEAVPVDRATASAGGERGCLSAINGSRLYDRWLGRCTSAKGRCWA